MDNLRVKEKETINLIEKIKNGAKKFLIPICDDLAYIQCEIIDNHKCKVHLGSDFYVETSFNKAEEIIKRKIKEEIKNDFKINSLDDKTFEILEQYNEDEEEKKKENEKEKEINKNNKKKDIEERNRKMLEQLSIYEPQSEYVIYNELNILPGKEIIKKIYKKLKL